MTDIRFEIDADGLTVEDMLLIEDVQEGTRPFHGMTSIMARFLVGENGQPLEKGAALAAIKKLTLAQFQAAAKAFVEAIQRKAVPPEISEG